MPVYNGGSYICEAINSLLQQTYKFYELIISDNASTDSTYETCQFFARSDSRVRYFRHAQITPAFHNFKTVLALARGEFFMWAAADDLWSPRWIEEMMNVVTKNKCIAYGRVQSINENGEFITHPANMNLFSYKGHVAWRRLRYLVENPALGKANPIYGIYPKTMLADSALAALTSDEFADTAFIYNLLASLEIYSTPTAVHYKRIHFACYSRAPCHFSIFSAHKPSFRSKLLTLLNLTKINYLLYYAQYKPILLLKNSFLELTTIYMVIFLRTSRNIGSFIVHRLLSSNNS